MCLSLSPRPQLPMRGPYHDRRGLHADNSGPHADGLGKESVKPPVGLTTTERFPIGGLWHRLSINRRHQHEIRSPDHCRENGG